MPLILLTSYIKIRQLTSRGSPKLPVSRQEASKTNVDLSKTTYLKKTSSQVVLRYSRVARKNRCIGKRLLSFAGNISIYIQGG